MASISLSDLGKSESGSNSLDSRLTTEFWFVWQRKLPTRSARNWVLSSQDTLVCVPLGAVEGGPGLEDKDRQSWAVATSSPGPLGRWSPLFSVAF